MRGVMYLWSWASLCVIGYNRSLVMCDYRSCFIMFMNIRVITRSGNNDAQSQGQQDQRAVRVEDRAEEHGRTQA